MAIACHTHHNLLTPQCFSPLYYRFIFASSPSRNIFITCFLLQSISLFLMASNNKHLVVKYLECMHNYAASSMSYVFDGCGEFCSAGAQGTPDFFICAACQCHRSFHRKMEVEVESEAELPINGTYLVEIRKIIYTFIYLISTSF